MCCGAHRDEVCSTVCVGVHIEMESVALCVLGYTQDGVYITACVRVCAQMGPSLLSLGVHVLSEGVYVALRGLVKADYTPCLSFRHWLRLPCLPSLPGGVCA